jgi:hypothetical protein
MPEQGRLLTCLGALDAALRGLREELIEKLTAPGMVDADVPWVVT